MNQPARVRYPNRSQVERAVSAWRAINPDLDPAAIEVKPDGTIRVIGPAAFTQADDWSRWENVL